MKKLFILFALLTFAFAAQAQTYLDPQADINARIDDALSRMSLNEKIAIIHAWSKFSSPGVPSLGIPGLWCTDGPHGIRAEVLWDEWNQAGWTSDSCTAFPALTCLAATWNPDMALLYGQTIGEEALYRGKNVLLGPGVNIYRTPLGGRNFEYMGEDPALAATMVVPYIKGVQQNGVATCVKHYALNNQEERRHNVNVTVDDRALYELYLPAFRAAVQEGGAWSIMGAYNKYKGQYACHNQYLLLDILRDEWRFDGAVISDWGGVIDSDEAIRNGLDLEFGTWTDGLTEGASNTYDAYHMASPYRDKILRKEVGTDELDQKVRNVLRLIFRTSMNPNKGYGRFTCADHSAAARRIAGEGMVLLRNEPLSKKNPQRVLPIRVDNLSPSANSHSRQPSAICHLPSATSLPTILVVGENAVKMMTVGGGSSSLKAKYEVSPLDGIRRRIGREAQVRWVRGYVGEAGAVQDGLSAGQDLTDNRSFDELLREAVDAAKEADLVIFVGGLNKSRHQDTESFDRLLYNLPYRQDELIEALAKANPRTVVVTISGNAFAMPWANKVPAIVQAWYSGSETGNALADILFGDVNPSGKLPFTILPTLADYPAHQFGQETYPGVNDEEVYTESFFVGYRYADLKKSVRLPSGATLSPLAADHQPLFPFGHGLSYTTFTYGRANLSGRTVKVAVTNLGDMPGKEVVQLYVAPQKAPVLRPVKELKAFSKVDLLPGETKVVEFEVTDEMLSYFDANEHDWILAPGKYDLLIGSSSADIRCKATLTIGK